MRKLRLPETLAFAVLTAGAVVTAASCGGDDGKSDGGVIADAAPGDGGQPDAYEGCTVFCIPDQFFDDGGPVIDGGPECPPCADENVQCPSGCRPVG